jgi:hypothetical protein
VRCFASRAPHCPTWSGAWKRSTGGHAVAVPRCDHCRLTRRRTQTYVVAHGASGERRRVGSGCLRDFLGGHDPVRMLRHAEHMTKTHATLERIASTGPRATHAGQMTAQEDQPGVPLPPGARPHQRPDRDLPPPPCAIPAPPTTWQHAEGHRGGRGRDPAASARYPQLQRCDLLDAHANRLVWWQTAGRPLRAGPVVRLRGRVRRHAHFGPIAVTVLSGCQKQTTLSTSPAIAEGD